MPADCLQLSPPGPTLTYLPALSRFLLSPPRLTRVYALRTGAA
jgi:hypothetical protein